MEDGRKSSQYSKCISPSLSNLRNSSLKSNDQYFTNVYSIENIHVYLYIKYILHGST